MSRITAFTHNIGPGSAPDFPYMISEGMERLHPVHGVGADAYYGRPSWGGISSTWTAGYAVLGWDGRYRMLMATGNGWNGGNQSMVQAFKSAPSFPTLHACVRSQFPLGKWRL
jgi:hypothetical protein